jgi:tetratricopeptide (TPR) repeat protein
MSYLLNKNKLSEMGTYFGLVQVQKLPVEKALLQAFDMSPAQFDEAVKTYYHSLDQLQRDFEVSQKAGASANRAQLYNFPAPRSGDDVEVTFKPITDPDIRAMLAEVMLRVPERRQKAISDLQAVLALKDKNGQPIKNEIAHRALAWEAMERKDWDNAADELGTASALNPTDTWLRYYLSLMKYKQAAANHQEIQGLANMMTDLKIALDWYPEFAEAYNMLAMARLQGGGSNSALDAIKPAMALSPRNEQYVYNLGLIYVSLKRWDPAQNTFERLTQSSNPKIVEAAKAQLKDFANLKKYGISGTAPKRTYQSSPFDELAQEAERREHAQAQPDSAPDKRPTQFFRGRLVSVDCSRAPSATLSLSNGAKTLKLHAADYKSLVVIGADEFSCDWRNRDVNVNYKSSGSGDGDVVSLEIKGD